MKEWYLENYAPNICGGYESDAIANYAQSNFSDVLYTDFSDTVLLCNCDLSEQKEIRCVIQGNSADTQLKSMERIGLFPIGTVKAGDYIKFENQYWLITGYPGNNKSYEKAVMQLCQYKLRWQNNAGEIIERYGNITSAAKYDVGENGNSTIMLTSNSFTVLMPCDDETLEIITKRMFIDRDYKNPTKVFKITRSDDVLYDYGEHGCVLSFIADKVELNPLTDNQELGLCDYIEPATPTPPADETRFLLATISGGETLRCGRAKTWTVAFTDSDGTDVTDYDFSWNVAGDIAVTSTVDNDKIKIIVDDRDCIGSSFLLQIIDNATGSTIAENEIAVISML